MLNDAFIHMWSICSYRLYSFFDVRDAAHLDSAFSNHLTRQKFHSCLSRSSFVGLLFHEQNKEWIMSRNLLPEKLLLECNITDSDVINLTEASRAVERISVRPTFKPLSSTVLIKLLQHSPSVKSFELDRSNNVDVLVYQTLGEKCANLTDLTVLTEDIDSAAMRALFLACRGLKQISIVDSLKALEDSVVTSIAEHCSNLTSLTLSPMRTIRAESVHLLSARCSRLTVLRIKYCHAALRTSLQELAQSCTALTELNLEHSHLDLSVVSTFARNNKQLRRLCLSFCHGVNDYALSSVARYCKQVESIDISFNSRITDWSVCELVRSCPNLKELVVTTVLHLTDSTLNAIVKHCSHLTHLDLSYCEALTPAALCRVASSCTTLVALNVSAESTCDALYQKLALHCPNFKQLGLYDLSTLLNPTALYSISNYLCRLQSFCCATLRSIPDAAVLQLVENCPHLRTLIVVRLLMVCQDKRIVKAIARNCPRLSHLHLGNCSAEVTRAIWKWRQSRVSTEVVEHVDAVPFLF